MDPDSNSIILQLVILLILIGVNAFFAMSEIAIVTFNDNKLKKLAEDGNKRAATLYKMVQQPSKFLSTIQIGVTMAGFLAAGSAAEQFAEPVAQLMSPVIPYSVAEPIALFVITLILGYFNLVLGELVPKRIAMHNPEKVSLAVAPIVRFVFTIAKPLVALLSVSTNAILKLIHISPEDQPEQVTEEEIRMMVDVGNERGVIEESQREMINNIFEFDDTTVGDVMTHRTEIVSVEENTPAADAVRLSLEHGFSRLPVYRKSLDDIVGILYVKDLFALWDTPEKAQAPVSRFMRGAMFVPEACRAQELLVDFKVKHTQIAVVVDEYGGTSGLATMEDVLEEIVGNIQDEFDNEDEDLVATEDGFVAAGSADLEEVFEAFGLEPPDEDEDGEADFDTVGGLIIDRLGRIPAAGEDVTLEYGGLEFTVLEVEDRRVGKVKCTRAPELNPENDDDEEEDA